MDPHLKLILETFEKRFAEQDARMEARFAEQDARMEARFAALEKSASSTASALSTEIGTAVACSLEPLERAHVEVSNRLDSVEASAFTRVAALESAAAAFDSWRPSIEGAINNLKVSIDSIRHDISPGSMSREREVMDLNRDKPSILGDPGSASAHPSGGAAADGPNWHRVDTPYLDQDAGKRRWSVTNSKSLDVMTYRSTGRSQGRQCRYLCHLLQTSLKSQGS